MSYVALGAVPNSVKIARDKLGPLYPVVTAHRAFISKLIVQWLNQNRGFIGNLKDSHKGGAEMGVLKGGPKGTVVDGKRISMVPVYGALSKKANWNNPKYDTMRAAALAVILKRDLLHVMNSAAAVLTGSLGRYRGIGEAPAAPEIPADVAPLPDTPAADAAVAQADKPAENIDFGALLETAKGFMEFIAGIGSAIAGVFGWIDEQNAAAAPAAATPPAVTLPRPPVFTLPAGSRMGLGPARTPAPVPSKPSAPQQTFADQKRQIEQPASSLTLPIAMGAGLLAAYFLLKKK